MIQSRSGARAGHREEHMGRSIFHVMRSGCSAFRDRCERTRKIRQWPRQSSRPLSPGKLFPRRKHHQRIFEPYESDSHWLRDPAEVNKRLLEIARSRLSHATALIVAAYFRELAGNINVLPSDCHEKSLDELIALITVSAGSEGARLTALLKGATIEEFTRRTYKRLETSLLDDSWKRLAPGRPILNIFCSSKFSNLPLRTI